MAYSSSSNEIEQFLDKTGAVEKNIDIIKANISHIQELQTLILGSTLIQKEESYRQERDGLMNDTRQLIIENKNNIKQLEYENARLHTSDPNYELHKRRHEFLREKLANAVSEYQDVASIYIRQQEDRMARQYKVVNPNATRQEINNYLSNPTQPVFQQAILRTGEAHSVLDQVKKRHKDIKNIEQTITELTVLLKELQLQVEEQDQNIIRIEENTEKTADRLEKAGDNLNMARLNAMSARKKKWICLGILLVIAAILIIIIIVKVPKSSSNSSQSTTIYTTVTSSPLPTSAL
ncbi:3198_t:CDS:1 [Cetraspora pellucida]|uniref:3198_t:CDS:1 n=1 Tax=Cetraspora pellucida TaxID=1433469 RepID=A0ACA9K7R8_9GLOM|nr:3198_t:CDS:1 [Cetraspora pellucida]